MRVKIQQQIKVYEKDGKEIAGGDVPTISVHSHWNHNDMVILVVEGKTVTVCGTDLIKAVNNARNS